MNDSLMHYASKYYDPVKAHEYYMQNRELKGRSRKWTQEETETYNYAKMKANQDKASEKATLESNRDSQIEELKSAAEIKRNEISNRIQRLNEQLSNSLDSKMEQLDREYRHASGPHHKEEILKRKEKLRNQLAVDKEKNYNTGYSEKVQVSTDLKNAISNLKQKYATDSAAIDSKYSGIMNEIFAKIDDNVSASSVAGAGNSYRSIAQAWVNKYKKK